MLVTVAEKKLLMRLRQLPGGVHLFALAKKRRGIVDLVLFGYGKKERLGKNTDGENGWIGEGKQGT